MLIYKHIPTENAIWRQWAERRAMKSWTLKLLYYVLDEALMVIFFPPTQI